ncbi:hypothetical protein ACH5RR_036284 [Cinchona calisaya]|uniref:Uncharacterized protein n=1 Tax=Cinchona calisaya TaxID=153742 RepID=A0ABD2Y7N9_9GENT
MMKTSIQSILVVVLFAIAIALSFPNMGATEQVVETLKTRKLLQSCACSIDADCGLNYRCVTVNAGADVGNIGVCIPQF